MDGLESHDHSGNLHSGDYGTQTTPAPHITVIHINKEVKSHEAGNGERGGDSLNWGQLSNEEGQNAGLGNHNSLPHMLKLFPSCVRCPISMGSGVRSGNEGHSSQELDLDFLSAFHCEVYICLFKVTFIK